MEANQTLLLYLIGHCLLLLVAVRYFAVKRRRIAAFQSVRKWSQPYRQAAQDYARARLVLSMALVWETVGQGALWGLWRIWH